jgi:hypothetical protein
MKRILVSGNSETITFSNPYINIIVAIMMKRLRSIVNAKAPKETSSDATCALKSLIEKVLAESLISSQCLSMKSSKLSLNEIAPIAKTESNINVMMHE